MGSTTPKVLLSVLGRPLLGYVLDAVRGAGVGRIILVVAPSHGQFGDFEASGDVELAVQKQRLGTGDAVLACRGMLEPNEDCIVLCGDAPLISADSLAGLVARFRGGLGDVIVLTAELEDPRGYGRIIRDEAGMVSAIVEERDASDVERRVREVNSGVYVFRWGRLLPFLDQLVPSEASGEYYLTDAVRALADAGGRVLPVVAASPDEVLGANTPEQFETVAALLAKRQQESGELQ